MMTEFIIYTDGWGREWTSTRVFHIPDGEGWFAFGERKLDEFEKVVKDCGGKIVYCQHVIH